MSEIEPEIPEIQETQETPEIDTEDEIPKKKAGRPKGSKNVAKAKAVKKTIEPPPETKSKIVTKPPVRHIHRKSRTRVIVLSSSSGSEKSDHKIRVMRKPAKRYDDSSDSDAPPIKSAPAPAPAPAPLEPQQRPTSTKSAPANRFAFDIQADHQLRAAATKRTYDSFFSHLR